MQNIKQKEYNIFTDENSIVINDLQKFNQNNPIKYNSNKFCLIKLDLQFDVVSTNGWLVQTQKYINNKYYNDNNNLSETLLSIFVNDSEFINNNTKNPLIINICNVFQSPENGTIYLYIPSTFLQSGFKYQILYNTLSKKLDKTLNIYVDIQLSQPIIKYDTLQYANESELLQIDNEKLNITLIKPICTICCQYYQADNDTQKYYQFELMDNENNLIGGTEKIFTSSSPQFRFENLNNKKQYKLRFCCVSQSNIQVYSKVLIINTDYQQDSIYTEMAIGLDKIEAINKISVQVIELTGDSDNPNIPLEYINNEKVNLTKDRYVTFDNVYNVPADKFLCRVWLENIVENTVLVKFYNNKNEFIDIKYYDKRFHAFKHSCNLITHYVSKVITNQGQLYFSLGYYNHRLELYAKQLTSEELKL